MQPFRVLIGYDATECAISALNDLPRCGLPNDVEAVVLAISEEWVPELTISDDSDAPPIGTADDAAVGQEPRLPRPTKDDSHESRGMHALHEAEKTADEGAARVRAMMPRWHVRGEARANGPAWGILEAARDYDPDLVLVGSHGRRALARVVLGSVSLRVLTDAVCSVRIARAPVDPHRAQPRIIVGLDGSSHALDAVRSLAERRWTNGATVRLVAVVREIIGESDRSTDVAAIEDPRRDLIVAQIETAEKMFAPTPIVTELVLRSGDPATALLDEAQSWDADAVVVGARGEDIVESGPVGSVSSKIAARAHCSVEVVRRTKGAREVSREMK